MSRDQPSLLDIQLNQWLQHQEKVNYKSAHDYAEVVRQWMWQCHMWKFYSMFPFGLPPPPPPDVASNVLAGLQETARQAQPNIFRQGLQGFPNTVPGSTSQVPLATQTDVPHPAGAPVSQGTFNKKNTWKQCLFSDRIHLYAYWFLLIN